MLHLRTSSPTLINLYYSLVPVTWKYDNRWYVSIHENHHLCYIPKRHFSGTEITDTVVIGDLVIAQQLVAVPSQLPDNYSFGGIGGIFGWVH